MIVTLELTNLRIRCSVFATFVTSARYSILFVDRIIEFYVAFFASVIRVPAIFVHVCVFFSLRFTLVGFQPDAYCNDAALLSEFI